MPIEICLCTTEFAQKYESKFDLNTNVFDSVGADGSNSTTSNSLFI